MIRAWRIVKRRYQERALEGEGARIHGGRWNTPGRPVVYASDSRALAMLEVLAGLGTTRTLPAYVLIGLSFDASRMTTVDRKVLPEDWRRSPPPEATRRISDRWLAQEASVVLRVPSALVPQESNYLLNPRHPDVDAVRVHDPEPLERDDQGVYERLADEEVVDLQALEKESDALMERMQQSSHETAPS